MTSAMPAGAEAIGEPLPIGSTADQPCYHCGEPVPAGARFQVELDGAQRDMCCPGCEAVATLIRDGGLTAYYRRRSSYGERPDPGAEISQAFGAYDQPDIASGFTTADAQGLCHARLLLGGVSCAACTWLIEQALGQLDGVRSVNVNLQHQRLDITLDTATLPLSRVFSRVEQLGYRAQPFLAQAQREQLETEHRRSLRRLAVAGLGMMQAGMFAIALHAGDLQGIETEYRDLMRWVSLLITSFVVLYCARTFFENAWRHLRAGALVMDLPVSLAIGLAWIASAWATVSGDGQVYFDSVLMFTFFLLLGRFLEQRVRRRLQLNWYEVESALPAVVQRRQQGGWSSTPRVSVQANDELLIPAGSTIPVDGKILRGASSVREGTFNGEHQPRQVASGDAVFAGTVNIEGALELCAAGPYSESRLAALQQSVGRASGAKPRLSQLADRVAGWFVLAVLVLTSATALVWYYIDPSRALWVSLSVLVISCPCALALATPAALTSAAGALRRKGVLVHGENALDALAQASCLIVDKTGTLTSGHFALETITPLAGDDPATLCALAAALQRASRHPVSRVFDQYNASTGFEALVYHVGAGVSARDEHLREWRMGSLDFCRAIAPSLPAPPDRQHYWVALVQAGDPRGWFAFDDSLRPQARELLQHFRDAGLRTEMLSGDTPERVALAARNLPLDAATGGLSPDQKLARLQALQSRDTIVAAVGDGLNDGPLLAQADASFAVADATDLARAQADFVIENRDLDAVSLTWRTARCCRRVMFQNIVWALAYNASAIPLAACGLVPPWAAALGMSASSLLVVLNSLRLTRNGT